MRHPAHSGVVLRLVAVVTMAVSGSAPRCLGQLRETNELARVAVVVTDSFGKARSAFRVVSFEDQHKRDFAGRFNEGSATDVPLGTYWIKLEVAGGGRLSRSVVIDRLDSLLVLSDNPFHADYPKGSAPVLSGAVRNLPAVFAEPNWVKMCGIFIEGCAVAQIDSHGHFSFVNVTPAAYTFELLGGSGQSLVERVEIVDPSASILFDGGHAAGGRITLEGNGAIR